MHTLLEKDLTENRHIYKELQARYNKEVTFRLKSKLTLNNPANSSIKKIKNEVFFTFFKKIQQNKYPQDDDILTELLYDTLKTKIKQEQHQRKFLMEQGKAGNRHAIQQLLDLYQEDVERNMEKGVRKFSQKGYLNLKKENPLFLDVKQDILIELSKDISKGRISIDILENCLYRKIQCKLTDFWKRQKWTVEKGGRLDTLPDSKNSTPEVTTLVKEMVELTQTLGVLYLCCFKKLSEQEIAIKLSLELKEVHTRKHHGITILCNIFKKKRHQVIKLLELWDKRLNRLKKRVDIIYLSFIEGLKVIEIAEQFDLPPERISQIKSEGITMFKKLLEAKGFSANDF